MIWEYTVLLQVVHDIIPSKSHYKYIKVMITITIPVHAT